MSILEVSGLRKVYTTRFGGSQVEALRNVNFSVEEGEYVAIMGESGSGKTTLLNILAALDRPTDGSVLLDGKDLSAVREQEAAAFRREQLGFVFQEYNLLDTLTVGENIVLPLNLKRLPEDETSKELKRVSQALGVADQLNKFPYELSGGQRQRAACARAIIASPALVLADEPTGALDSKNSKLLMKTFELMNESLGSTILTVTHDAVVGSYAGRVLFLKDGKIWSEVIKGARDRREMYAEILSVTAALGGDADVR